MQTDTKTNNERKRKARDSPGGKEAVDNEELQLTILQNGEGMRFGNISE